ncbi:hypothetical protein GCM10010267_66960 [Streptomyces griseorubens]|nr:hypothetical protein GCM10010267_66960 [Streptomyces griseorubens]
MMLAAALVMVAGLQAGGRLTRPDRVPLLLTSGAVGLAGSLAVLGQCHTLPTLFAAALIFGLTHGVLDVAVNTAAVRCQNAYGRPIMSCLHASYSIGALAGAALAAATARTAHDVLFLVTPRPHRRRARRHPRHPLHDRHGGSVRRRAGRRSAPAPREDLAAGSPGRGNPAG